MTVVDSARHTCLRFEGKSSQKIRLTCMNHKEKHLNISSLSPTKVVSILFFICLLFICFLPRIERHNKENIKKISVSK